MIRGGSAPEYIATLMNSTVDQVEQGRLAVERWKSANSPEIVQASLNEQAMIAMQPVGRTLKAAQSAKRMVRPPVYDDAGKQIAKPMYMPDHSTRIAATEAVARIVESVKDRGPGVQVNVGNQVNFNGNGSRSFEERIRIRREQLGMNKASVVIDANETVEADVKDIDGDLEEDVAPDVELDDPDDETEWGNAIQ